MSLLSDLNDKIKRLSTRVAAEFKTQQSAIDSKVSTVNGIAPDASGDVALSVSAPVTSVNGMTGAVTISSVSNATTATNATATPNVISGNANTSLPRGGTWKIFILSYEGMVAVTSKTFAGGSRPGNNAWIGMRIS